MSTTSDGQTKNQQRNRYVVQRRCAWEDHSLLDMATGIYHCVEQGMGVCSCVADELNNNLSAGGEIGELANNIRRLNAERDRVAEGAD